MADIKTAVKPLKTYLFQQNSIDLTNYDTALENGLLRLNDHPLKDEIYCENKLPKLALYCITPGIGYLPIVEYTNKALVVFDPIFPEVLHSFKNLSTANMWLNKFLKDFLVFESIDISLKWIIVKPGIIKMKQSQPFSPAIFENSPIIITKNGEIRFSKKELLKEEICSDYKRKLITDQVVDINGSDGKRKKIHLDTLNQQINAAKILTRTVNLLQQYPSKKSTIQSTATAVSTQIFNENNTSTLNSTNQVNQFSQPMKTSPPKHYQLIPNILIQMNYTQTFNNNNNNNNSLQTKSEYISNNATTSDGPPPNNFNTKENATDA
ncbi:hypothetical protein O3M35_008999 [Rhynocoris fuscipes]|uniref:Uncharacterized protein n=1 Tax=Rhynocoris fuscipes TaxID=488301 RepID=A0AAW1D1C9_9HEMI